MQAIDGLGRDLERGVESEGDVGSAEVVIDRLRHADHVQALLVKLVGDPKSVLAANRDQPIQVQLRERLAQTPHAVLPLVRIRPGAAEDGAAPWQNSTRGLDIKLDVLPLEHAPPPVTEAEQLIAELVDPVAHDGPYDGVQAGTVTTAG